MKNALQTLLIWVVLVLVDGTTIHLVPSSPDRLLLGCHGYDPHDNVTKPFFSTLSTNKITTSCLRGCAGSSFKLALSNNSLCICSHEITLINMTDCPQSHVMAPGNDVSYTLLHVYNTSTLFPGYYEMLEEVRFEIPPTVSFGANITNNQDFRLDFGDGEGYNLLNRSDNTSYVSHRYVKTGSFQVLLMSLSDNGSSVCHASRDVIIQQGIIAHGITCPPFAKTVSNFSCVINLLRGSDMTLELEVVNRNNESFEQEFQLQDTERASLGNMRKEVSSQANASWDDPQGAGTYIIPGEHFNTSTVLEAWEVLATARCSAKLQVFRPIQTNCSMTCWPTSYFCKKWHPVSSQKCIKVCLETLSCNRTNNDCKLNTTTYESIFAQEVLLQPGYNFIPVAQSMRTILAKYGDVVGWASNNTKCIQAETSQFHQVLFSSGASSSRTFFTKGNLTQRNASFALRVHGYVPVELKVKFCYSQVSIISVRSNIQNLVPAGDNATSSAAVTVQAPVKGLYDKIEKFMVVNKSHEIVIKATDGTNLTCILQLPNRTGIVFSPFTNGKQTKGLEYHVMVTFHKSEQVEISFQIFNLVSKIDKSESTSVRIKVKGLKASIQYSGFAYQNALTFFNASITQGDFVEYHWIFTDPGRTFKSLLTTATHTYSNLGNFNVTLYAHNSASYEEAIIPTTVIPNPLSIQTPLYIKTGVPHGLGCQVVWPDGTPQAFYQKYNVSGRRGADLPEKVDTILEFPDGKIIWKNASVEEVYYTFNRDLNKRHYIKCSVAGHPDLNTQKQIIAIDPITNVRIDTTCPRDVPVGTTCILEAKFDGDFGQCDWVITDKDNTLPIASNCTLEYIFARTNECDFRVNVSNQVSSLVGNATFMAFGSHVSATVSIITSVLPTNTISMTTETDTATLTNVLITTTVAMETSRISPSAQYTSSSPASQTLASSASPNSTSSIPDIILACPSHGAVGQELAFEAYLTFGVPLTYSWEIDKSVFIPGSRHLHHAFQSPGIYLVTSKLTTTHGRLSRSCRVEVEELITGFRITKLELLRDLSVEIGFEVLKGTSVDYEVDFGEEGVARAKGVLQTWPSYISQVHQYTTPGEYTINIQVSSTAGPNQTINNTLLVTHGPCTIHDVTVEGGSRDPSSAPIILPQYEYSVVARVNASCDSLRSLVYRWRIINVGINESAEAMVETAEEVSLVDRELVLPPFTLPYGMNKLIAMVTVYPRGISKSVVGYVKVRQPDLIARIDCGDVRTVSRDREVVLDASRSYDPGTPMTTSSSLSFAWFCKCNGNDSWIGDDVPRNTSILRIPPKRLDNGDCTLAVEVTRDTRKASARQRINVVDGNFPPLCIRCIQNCDNKVHLNKPVVYVSKACQENKNLSCTWRLLQSSAHNVKKRSLPLESSKLVISQEDVKPNHTYTVSLKATIDGTILSNDLYFKTDNVPSGGACSITPSHGKAIETAFQIACSNWGDEDSPLWYEFYYDDPNAGATMMAYGWQAISPQLYLPNGQESRNYMLDIHVDVVDVLGSRTRVPLQATVTGFSKEDGPIGAILNSYIQGPSSILETMYSRGDDQQAVQFMTTIGSVLNEDSLANPGSDGQDEREKVRITLTKKFSNSTISSFPSLRQVLGGLRSATKVTAEVKPDAQIYGAKGYEGMAATLARKHVDKPIGKEADAIVSGLSDVLESSKITSSKAKNDEKTTIDWMDDSNAVKSQEILRKSRHAAITCLTGADQTARALVRRKKAGDSPSLVQSPNLEIAVQRQAPRDIGGMSLDQTGSTFTLPVEGVLDKTNGLGFVDAKVLTVKESPFPDQSPTPISSQVSSLELQDPDGTPIPISNLSQPISIFLANTQTQEVQSNISGVLDDQRCINISVYKIRVVEEHSSLYLEANCSFLDTHQDDHCILMWRKDNHPAFLEHDFSWKIGQNNGTFRALLTRDMLNGTGDYFLGIARDRTRNGSCYGKANSSAIFNVTVNVVNCLYWDEGKQQWSTSGCQVGPQTNRHSIHCLCNHLTWFGSRLFIPPNSLDLDVIASRISDPSYYLPVLAVLCTIWAVYALAMVWARRADKKDALKTEVMISPSNEPDKNYIYEVAITTGIRRHAGTTANTAIMMYGEIHDSEPYLLTDNESHRTLQRGTTSSFLLTTKESLGSLLHIRIWHDNKGKDPALFLKHIVVRDIQTGELSYFLCNRWFAVDEGDGMIDRVLPVTSEDEMAQFSHMFLAKTQKDLTDSHLWFSVFWRPSHSPFTRAQRVSCCLSLLLCTMMANAMWYEKDKGSYTSVDLGPFQFSWEQISIGILSSLVVFPVNLVLVQIFRHSKLRRTPDIPNRRLLRGDKVTPMKLVSTCMGSNYHTLKNERSSSFQLSQVEEEQRIENNSPKNTKTGLLTLSLATVFAVPHIPKSSKDKEDCCNNLIEPETLNNEGQKETKRKSFRGMPYWCSYIAWLGIVVTALVSTAVTLMYGIQFGRRTSEKWLLSMFASVTYDIFVSQPLKVIIFAVIFAFIIKKPNLNSELDKESDIGKRQRWSQSRCLAAMAVQAPCPPVTKPSEDTLEMARKRRLQEKQMAVIVSDIVTYLLFLLIVLLISYGQRDKSSFLQKESAEGLLMRTNYSGLSKGYQPDQFQKASMVADIWPWLEKVFLPIMYNIPWYHYTGRPTPFINGGSGMTVGVARLRQLRTKKGGCKVPDDARFLVPKCVTPYSMLTEDQSNYLPGWIPANTSTPNPSQHSLWHYNSASELRGFPVIGDLETYSGGGYVLKFSPVYYKALKQIHNAKDQLWIDRYSRAIFVEFNLYNPSSNLFSVCTVMIEMMQSGGVTIKQEFLTYRLYRYVGDFQLFIVAMELLFLLFVTYFTYREGKSFYKKRCEYFKSSWVWMEIIIIILSWVTIAHYFVCIGIRKWTLQQYLDDPSNFTNFHYISTWQQVFENFMALTVFMACCKMIKLLSFNKRMYMLAHTLKHAARDLRSYWILFLLVFIAFSQLYYQMLGSEYLSFSTFIRSMEKLLSVILGKFSFEEFMKPFRVLGAITFILYMFVTKFLLLNILIVLVISSFQEVKLSNKKMKNDFEMVDFMIEQLKAISGIRFLKKSKSDTNSETTNHVECQSSSTQKDLEEVLLRVDKLDSTLMEQDYCDMLDKVLDKYLKIKSQRIKRNKHEVKVTQKKRTVQSRP